MLRVEKTKEKGQIMVLLVLAVVGLMGFAALAIDGGMAYSDRRHAQNATDAASLAGGSAAAVWLEENEITHENFTCGGVAGAMSVAKQAAIERANTNDFQIEGDLQNHHGVEVSCTDYFNGAFSERYIDITVEITAETRTAMVHLVYDGPTKNRVAAVSRIYPQAPIGFGQAIVGLNNLACDGNNNGVIIHGSADLSISGGGIFSNGCMKFMGAQNLNVFVNPPNIAYVEELIISGNVALNATPSQVSNNVLPEDATYIPPPDCDQVPYYENPSTAYQNNANGHIPPGNYTSIKFNGTGTLEGGGLYCVNGNFDVGNNDLSIISSGGQEGVTIYLISGSFITTSTGGKDGKVNLKAPTAEPDPYPAIAGVLIYLAEGNSGTVKLTGNSESSFYGMIYAPSGTIDAYGTPGHEATFHTQFVGKNVKIGGNAKIDVNYSGGNVYRRPTMLNLHQ